MVSREKMQGEQVTPSAASHREIVQTRLIDAPRDRVFAAFNDAAAVARWWGPHGFTTTTHVMDVRRGGRWRFIMHGPDGTDYSNRIVYSEVTPPSRLAYAHGEDSDDARAMFHVTLTFDDEAGKTRLTMISVFATREERDQSIQSGAVEGGRQTLDRLEQFLAT
jgi:uncharacterized protein YndB with AHSA1/START domain